jgi:hypothetical protein
VGAFSQTNTSDVVQNKNDNTIALQIIYQLLEESKLAGIIEQKYVDSSSLNIETIPFQIVERDSWIVPGQKLVAQEFRFYDKNRKLLKKENYCLVDAQFLRWDDGGQIWEEIKPDIFIVSNISSAVNFSSFYNYLKFQKKELLRTLDTIDKKKHPEFAAQILDDLVACSEDALFKKKEFAIQNYKGNISDDGLISNYQFFKNNTPVIAGENRYIEASELPGAIKKLQQGPYKVIPLDNSKFFSKRPVITPPSDWQGKAGYGFTFVKIKDRVLVLNLIEGYPAQLSSLKPGYQIRRINEISVKELDESGIKEMINQCESIVLDCLNFDGKNETIKLTRAQSRLAK